jgi:DNA-binding CsgD family transcriptional regulator
LQAALRIHRVATRVASLGEIDDASASLEALEALTAIMPIDCAVIGRWDRRAKVHSTLANIGYPEFAVRQFERLSHTAPNIPHSPRDGRLLRLADVPRAERRGAIHTDVIENLGFSDGVSMCLSVDGICVGALHASTSGCNIVDNDALAVLHLVAGDLATIADPMHTIWAQSLISAGAGAFVWDESNDKTVPLTDDAWCELVSPTSPIRKYSALNGRREVSRTVSVISGRELVRIESTRQGRWTLCTHEVIEAPNGLTIRELEVLAELAAGKSNREIAASLLTSERTVTSHMEHILTKLSVRNRTAAAAAANRLGLLRIPVTVKHTRAATRVS